MVKQARGARTMSVDEQGAGFLDSPRFREAAARHGIHGGGFWDVARSIGQAVGQKAMDDLRNPNGMIRGNLDKVKDAAQGTPFQGLANAASQANDTAKMFGFGRVPRAKPRWSERTKAKHAFMRALSKDGVPLAKLARAAAAAQAAQERGASMEVAMDAGRKAVGM